MEGAYFQLCQQPSGFLTNWKNDEKHIKLVTICVLYHSWQKHKLLNQTTHPVGLARYLVRPFGLNLHVGCRPGIRVRLLVQPGCALSLMVFARAA